MGRFSDKEKIHFIEIALGSLYETMSQLELALDFNYIEQEEFNTIESEAAVRNIRLTNTQVKNTGNPVVGVLANTNNGKI